MPAAEWFNLSAQRDANKALINADCGSSCLFVFFYRRSLLYPALLTLGGVCLASIVALPLGAKARVAKGKVKSKRGMDPFTEFWMEWMTEYRGVVMVMVVLPLSFAFEQYFEVRDWFYRTFQVAPRLHDARVRHVQKQVRRWNAAGLRGKRTMCTARASWLTM